VDASEVVDIHDAFADGGVGHFGDGGVHRDSCVEDQDVDLSVAFSYNRSGQSNTSSKPNVNVCITGEGFFLAVLSMFAIGIVVT
jgi:hypothetical protein